MNDLTEELTKAAADGRSLERLARALVRDGHAAEDLIQDAYLALLETRSKIRDGAVPWLTGTLKLLAKKGFRGAKNRDVREASAARDEATEASDAWLIRLERRRLLVDHICSLDRPDREVVVMRFFEAMTPQGIARRLGISDAAARTRLSRALSELRNRLDRTHGGDRTLWRSTLLPLLSAAPMSGTGAWGIAAVKLKSKLALVVVVLLCVVGGLVFYDFESSDDSMPTDSPPSGVEIRADAARRATTFDAAPLKSPMSTAPQTDRSVDLLPISNAPVGRIVKLTVVDKSSGQPVSNAEVFTFDPSSGTGSSIFLMTAVQREMKIDRRGALRQFGRGFVTAPDGTVTLDGVTGLTSVHAFNGKMSGYLAWVDATAESIVMPIVVERSIDVTVVDAEGHPVADMPISFGTTTGDDRPDVARERAVSDASGKARISTPWLFDADVRNCFVGLDLPGLSDVEGHSRGSVYFDVESPPEQPVRLEVPPTGRIVVEAFHSDGSRVASGRIMLMIDRRESDRKVDLVRVMTASVRDGKAEFERCLLGVDLVGSFEVPGRPRTLIDFSGPRTAGDVVRHRIDLRGRNVPVSVRFIDDGGQALGGRIFRVRRETEDLAASFSATMTTDPNGRSRFDYHDDGEAAELKVWIFEEGKRGEATFAIAIKKDAVDFDAGDVIVPLSRPTIAGLVVDASHRPIAGASVHVRIGGPDLRLRMTLTTRSDGRFEFEPDDPVGTPIELGATADGWRTEEDKKASVGDVDLLLKLSPAASVSGAVLLPEGGDPTVFRVVLEPVGDTISPSSDHLDGVSMLSTRPGEDGKFAWTALPTGTYRLRITDDIDRDSDVLIDGIRLDRDGDRHRRLSPIHLGTRYDFLKLIVRDSDGRPVGAGSYLIRSDGSSIPVPIEGRPIPLAKERGFVGIVVEASGFSAECVPPTAGTRTVTLLRTTSMNVDASREGFSLPDDVRFGISLVRVDGLGDDVPPIVRAACEKMRRTRWTGNSMSIRMPIVADVPYSVSLWVEKTIDGELVFETVDAQETRVTPTRGSDRLVVTPDVAALARALGRLWKSR